jgi:hypothetical protein
LIFFGDAEVPYLVEVAGCRGTADSGGNENPKRQKANAKVAEDTEGTQWGFVEFRVLEFRVSSFEV